MFNKTLVLLSKKDVGNIGVSWENRHDREVSYVTFISDTGDSASPGENEEILLRGKYLQEFQCKSNCDVRLKFILPNGDTEGQLYLNTSGGELTVNESDFYFAPSEPNGSYLLEFICYITDTEVTLANGSKRIVNELVYEDELLVWDFDNGCFASAKPLWITKPRIADHYYRLKFDDGTELCLVGSDGKCHRLMNIENGEFTYGSHFHVGQHTFKEDGSNPRLVSIELVEEEVEYYNVATHYHMNCFANGILSSTGYNNMYPIKDMKFVKDNRELIPFEDYVDVPRQFYDSLRLGEQDLSKRSIEKAKNYVGRMLKAMK